MVLKVWSNPLLDEEDGIGLNGCDHTVWAALAATSWLNWKSPSRCPHMLPDPSHSKSRLSKLSVHQKKTPEKTQSFPMKQSQTVFWGIWTGLVLGLFHSAVKHLCTQGFLNESKLKEDHCHLNICFWARPRLTAPPQGMPSYSSP